MNQSVQGVTIKDIRQRHGLTAQSVAELAGVPLRVPYLMEIGCRVSRDDAMKVLQALSSLTNNHSTPTNVTINIQ